MRTTIRINDELYRRAKVRAVETGRTVAELIEDAVRESLEHRTPAGSPPPLPTFGGSGVLPGVDLTSSAALVDAMDAGEQLDALR
jgi:hypothetical protein